MIDPEKILFIPSVRKGNGTGHLKRCIDWGRELGAIHFYTPQKETDLSTEWSKNKDIMWHDTVIAEDWKMVIIDNRETDKIPESLSSVPVIAIDESGLMRRSASYTIDIIPGMRPGLEPNIQTLGFMNTPVKKRPPGGELKNILVSFGGEDPSGLSLKLLNALKSDDFFHGNYNWHIVSSALEPAAIKTDRIKITGSIPELRTSIPEYDLVICSFGLTAFEALSCEVPVILMNPSLYHDKLSSSAGLTFLPKAWKKSERILAKEAGKIMKNRDWLDKICQKQFGHYKQGNSQSNKTLPRYLASMEISRDSCPACGSKQRNALVRFTNKSYFRCSDCTMIYMVQFRKKDTIYTEDYFFSEYKSQYGKTYIEDFENIASMGQDRLAFIKRFRKKKGRLLDIGCAYGPFLREAYKSGYETMGLEIAPEAVDYVNNTLHGITARSGNIEDPSSEFLFEFPFDVVTFWYVIEHMQRLDEVLPRVARMLNPGGLLCLSTPYGRGISALKNRKEFLRSSPEDHYSVWTKSSARRILKKYGFGKIRFRSTGHHPERFPRIFCILLPFSLRALISRLFSLGDSFEIYAKRDIS